MVTFKTLFNADSIDLHDLRADPNTVIRIQGLVLEMLSANENRRLGIRQTILEEYGLYALPGIISATYVLADRLSNKTRQDMIAQLLVDLCKDSAPAIRLLLHAGLLDNPFDVSRKIAGEALKRVNGLSVCSDEIDWILQETNRLVSEEEREAAITVFDLLLDFGVGFDEALKTCQRWFASPYDAEAPSKLLSLLLRNRDQIEQTLTAIFSVLDRKDEEAGRRIREFVDLPDPQSIIPAIAACSNHLQRERIGRVKSVEFLFEGAIARQIGQHPEVIPELLEYIVLSPLDSGIVRYWWQAMSAAVKAGSDEAKQYFERPRETTEDYDFVLWAYVQLIFLRDGPGASKKVKQWAKQVLEELAQQDAETYLDAQDMVERLRSGGGGNGPTRKNLGVTTI